MQTVATESQRRIRANDLARQDAEDLKELEEARKNKGCISYELFEVEGDTGHMVFIETWKDKSALDAHSKTEHFVRIIDELTKMSYKEAVVTAMTQKL